jgi:hypothetical protein
LRLATGNIRNAELVALFTRLLSALEKTFKDADFIDLSVVVLTIHARADRR